MITIHTCIKIIDIEKAKGSIRTDMYTISKYLNLNKDLNGSLRLIEFISLLMNKYSSTNISMVRHFEYIAFESGIFISKIYIEGYKAVL